jgi:S-adenosylmethionine:tRNA ribosyltransferase-isomerase
MRLSDYDYELPDRLIARQPAAERRGSRLLEVSRTLVDRRFDEFPQLLRTGDLLVFNDTRVIAARLAARKVSGGRAEILIERLLSGTDALAQVRASKTPKPGSDLLLAHDVTVRVLGRRGDLFELRFSAPVASVLEVQGEVPLPPYLDRGATAADSERYQTVYAEVPGAVAAPTAGLHFDRRMLAETAAMGVGHAFITLHVGAGTFKPLRDEQVERNRLHGERVRVDEGVCAQVTAARAAGGRVIGVGTTSVRALESAAAGGELRPFDGETELFIHPGYRFRTVDAMLTNFHLPRSSLLLLVAAFAGRERVLEAYRFAVEHEYRFFSYGDCMFLTPP